MDNIDIRLLRIFLVLMADRSVSTSAQTLGVSQSAASQALARLRILFDDPLLLRARGGMIISNRAPEFEDGVRELLEVYDKLMAKAKPFDPSTSTRTFVISAPEYAERLLLAAVIRRARIEAPRIRVEVHPPDRQHALELLESGRLDLRVGWLRQPQQSLRSMQLFEDQIVCIAAADHPTLRGTMTQEQFLTLPHVRSIGTGRTSVGAAVDEAIERLGRKPAPAVLVQNVLTIPLLMGGSDLIATVPKRLADFLARQHALQILEPPLGLPRIKCAAYWHERAQKDLGHRWLRALVSDAAKELSGTRAPKRL